MIKRKIKFLLCITTVLIFAFVSVTLICYRIYIEKSNIEPISITTLIEASDFIVNIIPISDDYTRPKDNNKFYYRCAVNWYWSDLEISEKTITIVHNDELEFDVDSQYYVFLVRETSSENIYSLVTDENYIITSKSHSDNLYSSNASLNKSIRDNVGNMSCHDFYYWLVSAYGEPKFIKNPEYSNFTS